MQRPAAKTPAAAEKLVRALDSKFFKALSEPVRIQILKYLLLNGRADISAIAAAMPQDRSVVSRHLNLMQAAGLLTSAKIGRHVYYEIDGQMFVRKLQRVLANIQTCLPWCCPP